MKIKSKPFKKCSTCKETKSVSEFYIRKKSGYSINPCKACKAKYSRVKRDYFIERIAERKKAGTYTRNYKLYEEKDIVKSRARNRTRYAIRSGILKRGNCIVCDKPKGDAHHPDYNDHLNVIWLCRMHHKHWHLGEIVKQGDKYIDTDYLVTQR